MFRGVLKCIVTLIITISMLCGADMMFRQQEQPNITASKLPAEKAIRYLSGVQAAPLRFFCPNGAQEKVITTLVDAAKVTKVPTLVVTYANGVGKTTIVCHILANFILGTQNGWFDYKIFQNFPFPKKIWYCSEPDFIQDKFIPEFEKLINPMQINSREYNSEKQGKHYISRYEFVNGWVLSTKSYEQSPRKYEADDLGIIVNDEPAHDEIRSAQKARRRMGCITLNIMTPLYCEPGVYDELQKAEERVTGGEKRKIYHLEADVYAACKKRGVRGHLDPEIIDDMVVEYDEEEKEAKVYGKLMYFSGRIYPHVYRDTHFVSPEKFPIHKRAKILQLVDPHDSRESACIYIAINPVETMVNGSIVREYRLVVFDETPVDKSRNFWEMTRTQTVEEEIQDWIELEERHKVRNVTRIMDRHFGWQTRGQKTLALLYSEAGRKLGKNFSFISSYTSNSSEGEVQYGHKVVRKLFKPLADGEPGIVVWDTCYHMWQGITHYIRKHETTKSSQDKAAGTGKIVEKYKDFCDTLRFGACHHARPYAEPEKESTLDRKLRKWRNEDRYNGAMDS